MPQNLTVPFLLAEWGMWRRVTSSLEAPLHQEHGLTRRELLILTQIAQGADRAGDLVRALHLPKYTVSRVLDGLDQGGLTVRESDTHDARRQVVRLTPQGWRRQEAAQRTAEALIGPELERLGPGAAHLITLLERFGHRSGTSP